MADYDYDESPRPPRVWLLVSFAGAVLVWMGIAWWLLWMIWK